MDQMMSHSTSDTDARDDQDGPEILGGVDGLDADHGIGGWFKFSDQDDVRLSVHLYHENQLIGDMVADLARRDVAAAGHGDGRYGFRIALPLTLFDGAFHRVELRLNHNGIRLGKTVSFGVMLPKLHRTATITSANMLEMSRTLFPPKASQQASEAAFRRKVTDAITDLSEQFGPATAINLLYTFALGRAADHGGLVGKLAGLHDQSTTIADIVDVVFDAAEFTEKRANSYLAPLSVLTCWCSANNKMLVA